MLYRMLVFFTELTQNKASQTNNNYPEPLGKIVNEGAQLNISDEFGAHQLLSKSPLNTGFINHLFQELNIQMMEQIIISRWQNIVVSNQPKNDFHE